MKNGQCSFSDGKHTAPVPYKHNSKCCMINSVSQYNAHQYCRTSKPKQSIERQIRNIKAAYPDAVIVQEVFTRTRLDRPEWLKLMRRIQPGDEIVFDSVSRMSGDAKEGFAAYEYITKKWVKIL